MNNYENKNVVESYNEDLSVNKYESKSVEIVVESYNEDLSVNKYENKNVEIVVARYNEDLSWIKEYPFNQFEYIVYNKGDNSNFEKTNVKSIINISNVGTCDHTYLYHIINNFDKLTNITVFLPGSVHLTNKKDTAIKILNNIICSNYTTAYFVGLYFNSIKHHYKNFKIDNHIRACNENNFKNSETSLLKCKIRPYGNWYNYFFSNTPAHWVALGGIFSIDKRDVIQHSIDRYQKLIETVNFNANHEAAHYIERSWGVIFFPMIYTQKIQS